MPKRKREKEKKKRNEKQRAEQSRKNALRACAGLGAAGGTRQGRARVWPPGRRPRPVHSDRERRAPRWRLCLWAEARTFQQRSGQWGAGVAAARLQMEGPRQAQGLSCASSTRLTLRRGQKWS